VPIRDEEDGTADDARERITEQRESGSGRRRDESDEADPQVRRGRRRKEEPPEDSEEVVVEEYVEEDEPRVKRPKRKRKKKRFHPVPDGEEERETPAWVWWVGGAAGIALTFLTLIVIAMIAPAESDLQTYAVILIVTLPISTVIFFVAMILASVLVGAVEIGEIHVAVVKSFGLILAVSLVSLIPYIGRYLTPLVWIPGLMLLFRLDFWETCMVMFFNWVPNFLLRLLLMAMLASWTLHGGGGGGMNRDESPTRSKPAGASDIWDEGDVDDRGGWVQFDPNSPDQLIVVGISFRDTQIGDADLAHMKDFPRLIRLDLANTQVTDVGLKHLAACKQLQELGLSGTRVTAAGTNELRKALPNLRIFQ
jgi:hypothetical protein